MKQFKFLAAAILAIALIPAPGWGATYPKCGQHPNLACSDGTDVANQDISTVYNIKGTNSPLTFDGTTANSNKITISLSADPAASFTATIPADAASAMGKAVTCSGGQHVSAFSATSGAFTCSADSGGNPPWDTITSPTTSDLSLTMGTHVTAMTFGDNHTTTGWTMTFGALTTTPAISQMAVLDTTGNTNTGPLLDIHTVGTSTAKPIQITAQGTANGVQMTTAGLLQKIGTGGIKATTVATGGLASALTWNEACTASPCVLGGTPRTTDTLIAQWRGLVMRRVTACGGVGEYTLSTNTFTPCDTTGLGSGADSILVTYEL